MNEIIYRKGDIFADAMTRASNGYFTIVAHVVNNVGAFGAGFAGHMAREWPKVRNYYIANYRYFSLGDLMLVPVDDAGLTMVANLFAQDGLPGPHNKMPLKYNALRQSLWELCETIHEGGDEVQVTMPRIGSGLARGNWTIIEAIVWEELVNRGVEVIVYDLP